MTLETSQSGYIRELYNLWTGLSLSLPSTRSRQTAQSSINSAARLSSLTSKMHSFVTYTLLASASLVAAIDPRFEFPDTVPALLKRQAPGTPQYACHEDCGRLQWQMLASDCI